MSQTDLELCQELPKIRVVSPKIRPIQTPEPSEAKVNTVVDLIIQRRDVINADDDGRDQKEEEEEEEEEDGCRTPTSEEHRIPEMLTCPPAPRKPVRVPACKRKLNELEFFEATNRRDVDDFFRSSFVVVKKAKRINCCICK